MPGLILEHNLHGVDIDPRCAQIAQLALWMRAQKAYRDFGIGRAERAQIRRSNIVVAEPLVADEQIAKEFVAKLGDAELGRVFTCARRDAEPRGRPRAPPPRRDSSSRGRRSGARPATCSRRPRSASAPRSTRFVREEASATNTRRRLFADDAAQGVALLELAEKKFDVVLMNPPFGAGSRARRRSSRRRIRGRRTTSTRRSSSAGSSCSASRGRARRDHVAHGLLPSSFQKWREEILLKEAPPVVFADLGLGVLDSAMVEAAAYCLEARS